MKQLFQDLEKGYTKIVEAPVPKVSGHTLLIDTKVSLISAGTERMLVDFGKANLIDKARQQPEKAHHPTSYYARNSLRYKPGLWCQGPLQKSRHYDRRR